jgi:hypothetical protein
MPPLTTSERRLGCHAIAVERGRAEATQNVRPLADIDEVRHHLLAELVKQEGRFAIERPATGGMHQATEQAGGERCFKKHREFAGLDLAPASRATARSAAMRPTVAGSLSSLARRLVVYQSSRCMASCSPAITEHEM